MGRCKNLGSLEFFLGYASNSLGTRLSKAHCALCCFSPRIPLRVQSWATAVGYDLTLVELDGEQSSLFFVHGVKEGVSANHCDLPVTGPRCKARLCPPHTQPRPGFTVTPTGLQEASSGTLVGNTGLPAAAKIS